MEDLAPFLCYMIYAGICMTVSGIVAHNKGRNVLGWTLLGIIGWIPMLIVCVLPNLKEQVARDTHVNEENRRLREQLRQERIKAESFRQHATSRLDAHDQHLGLDTRQASNPSLGTTNRPAGQLSSGNPYDLAGEDASNSLWYYGRQGKTIGPINTPDLLDLIRRQVVTRETLLWSEKMPDWQPAGIVRTFATHFR
jgi:hypothetical protein